MIAYFKAETPGEVYRLSNHFYAWQVLWEMDRHLRSVSKYNRLAYIRHAAQELRDMLHTELWEQGVSLDEAGRE